MSPATARRAARKVVLGLGALRLVEGIYVAVATGDFLHRLGAVLDDDGTRAGFRMKAGRDVALGLLTLAAADDDRRLAELAATAIIVDGVDGLVMARHGRGAFGDGPVPALGTTLGLGVAAAASWAARQLTREPS